MLQQLLLITPPSIIVVIRRALKIRNKRVELTLRLEEFVMVVEIASCVLAKGEIFGVKKWLGAAPEQIIAIA